MRNIARSDIRRSRSLETKSKDLQIGTLQMDLIKMGVMRIITNNTGPRTITQMDTIVHKMHFSRFRILAGVGMVAIMKMDVAVTAVVTAVVIVVMIGDAVGLIVRKVTMRAAAVAVNTMVYYKSVYGGPEAAD